MLIEGDLAVTGVKGAVVPHEDGSHRLLCAIESPESWFEDFGEAALKDGWFQGIATFRSKVDDISSSTLRDFDDLTAENTQITGYDGITLFK